MLRNLASNGLYGSLALLAYVPNAYALLPCTEKWTGPSAGNDFAKCDLAPWAARKFGPPVIIPFVISIVTFLLFLFALIGRYCCRCCGSYRRRPGHFCCGGSEWDDVPKEKKERMYSSRGIRCLKFSVFLVTIISILGLLLMAVGVYRLGIAYNDVWNDANRVVTWVSEQVEKILKTLTLPDGTLAGGLDKNFIANLNAKVAEIQKAIDDVRLNTANQIWSPISIAGYVIATIPFIFFLAGLLMACCNVRVCGPLLVILCVWIVGILFCILGLAFTTVHYIGGELCEEGKAQEKRQPGIFQWYIVPQCQTQDFFSAAQKQIADTEITASQGACKAMLPYCSVSNSYNVLFPDKLFQCSYETTYTSVCTSADAVNRLITLETIVKTAGGPPNVCATVPNAQCSVLKCSTDCTDASLRATMADVVSRLDQAVRLKKVIQTEILPLLDCNTIVDQGVSLLRQCPAITKNSAIIAGGCYVYVIASLLLIFFMFLGQKRFFNSEHGNENVAHETEEKASGKGN